MNIKPIEHGLDDLLEMPAEVSPKNVINVELLQMVVKQALGLEPEPVIDGEVIDIKQITRNDVDEAK